jgi:CubicO group peptidase (beta-lactamase class C family)
MLRSLPLAALLTAALGLPLPAQKRAPALEGFEAYVENAIKEWGVPGLAIVVVSGDAVVHARGYGVRTVGRPEAVDEHTVFAVGSTTKAFTAALLGMLVDEGKLRWDDAVTKLLPGFQMYDPYVTRELTVRDMLSHRSGLSRGDLTWYGSELGRDEIVNRVRYMKPTWGLRSNFGYQNIMYLTAGQLVARLTGSSWDEVVRARILTPLGMSETSTSVNSIAGLTNVATPHATIDGAPTAIAYRNIDNIGPAGSINSTVTDYARWIRFQLDSGKSGGKSLLSPAVLAETHTPNTVIRYEGNSRRLNPYTHLQSYGLGWFVQDFRGRELVQHGGNIDGMTALVALMPEEKLGLAIFANMNGTGLNSALMYAILERFVLGYQSKDWSAEALRIRRDVERMARETERRREAQRVTGTAPSLPLAKYVSTYHDSLYGEMRVSLENGHLVARHGEFIGDLEHWHYDTFRATWRDRTLGRSYLTFALGADGAPGELVAELAETIRLRRTTRPGTPMPMPAVVVTEADSRKLLGVFTSASPNLELRVEWVQGAMTAKVPGPSPYTLVPVSSNRFSISGPDIPDGSFLTVSMEDGRVRTVTLERPGGKGAVALTPR